MGSWYRYCRTKISSNAHLTGPLFLTFLHVLYSRRRVNLTDVNKREFKWGGYVE